MASLYDVASRAGVSKTLVSRVLNNKSGVSAASHKKIHDAMQELNYVPNAIARSLVLKKTGVIGVVLDSLCESYFFSLISGIEDAIAQSNYDVQFCSGKNDVALKERKIQFYSVGRADGVIIYGSNISDIALIQNLAQKTFPFIVVENEGDFSGINSITVDNVSGGEQAVDHLASLGCRNIWHFTGDMARTISLSRRDGYINGMKRNGLPVEDHMIIESGFEEKVGYLQMKQLIRANRKRLPDGIFFAADAPACGALAAMMEENISVPEEIKVVGFDNDRYCYHSKISIPSLTTLNQPLYDMGSSAVQILLENILNPDAEKQHISFLPELIIRESTIRK